MRPVAEMSEQERNELVDTWAAALHQKELAAIAANDASEALAKRQAELEQALAEELPDFEISEARERVEVAMLRLGERRRLLSARQAEEAAAKVGNDAVEACYRQQRADEEHRERVDGASENLRFEVERATKIDASITKGVAAFSAGVEKMRHAFAGRADARTAVGQAAAKLRELDSNHPDLAVFDEALRARATIRSMEPAIEQLADLGLVGRAIAAMIDEGLDAITSEYELACKTQGVEPPAKPSFLAGVLYGLARAARFEGTTPLLRLESLKMTKREYTDTIANQLAIKFLHLPSDASLNAFLDGTPRAELDRLSKRYVEDSELEGLVSIVNAAGKMTPVNLARAAGRELAFRREHSRRDEPREAFLLSIIADAARWLALLVVEGSRRPGVTRYPLGANLPGTEVATGSTVEEMIASLLRCTVADLPPIEMGEPIAAE